MPPFEKMETYLGDGVYATYDGFHILLDLRAQRMPDEPLTMIALDPDVFIALVRFNNTIKDLTTPKGDVNEEGS